MDVKIHSILDPDINYCIKLQLCLSEFSVFRRSNGVEGESAMCWFRL
jgi:hypothetical protein